MLLLVSKSIIMKALLAAEGRLKGINEEQLDKFVMVERWRKVGKIETIIDYDDDEDRDASEIVL